MSARTNSAGASISIAPGYGTWTASQLAARGDSRGGSNPGQAADIHVGDPFSPEQVGLRQASRWGNPMPWRPQDRRATYGADYRRKRDAAMARAGWRCEIRLDGCRGVATECDHIHGVAADPNHNALRAACHSCHAKVTARNRGNGRRDPSPKPWSGFALEERTKW